jgi:hypothetical protein
MLGLDQKYLRQLCGRWAATLLVCGALVPLVAADVTAERARRALDFGVRKLKRAQLRYGTWRDWRGQAAYQGGATCLATLALLQAGEPVSSAAMQAALEHIRQLENRRVYVAALKIMALAKADPEKFLPEIEAAARWLIKAQVANGLWSYSQGQTRSDHSNAQFALLGLHAAAEAGVDVPSRVWNRARVRLLRNQNEDGGWGYTREGPSYGSMTAAGVADLIILGSSVVSPQERGFRDGAAPGCGTYKSSRALVNALTWLGHSFRADQNPRARPPTQWLYYWLYAVERCGILSGRRYFGEHDWYREGVAHLVASQNHDGGWGGDTVDTAFAVLFLAKGRKPLLIQKLKWSRDDAWNPDRNDVAHLIGFIGDKLGEPTAWQVLDFNAPLEDWLAAPLLYFHGHEFPRWNVRQREKVRKYVEQGGTLLAEACCGRADFREGFERFIADTFPAAPLRELDAGHPVYSAFFDLKPAGLMGVDVGCRTSILYSPNDISCLWEQGDIPVLSERAFRLGTNIAAYAMGRQALRDRLDVITLPEAAEVEPGPPPGDALRLAQVVYDGDWHPDPQALVHFAEFLRENVGLDVVSRYRPVRLTDEELYANPVLYMSGHYRFELSAREIAGLVGQLRRGGFLLAEACCGRAAFDESFRVMVKRAFPDSELKRLPANHPIFRGEPGFRLETVGYKPAALAENPDLSAPELWGLEVDGRLALVYSPYAIGCGLDGHVCYNCRGLLDEDARKLATNVVLYALTH